MVGMHRMLLPLGVSYPKIGFSWYNFLCIHEWADHFLKFAVLCCWYTSNGFFCVVSCSVVLAGTYGVYVVFVMVVNHNLWCSMSCCIYCYKIMVRSCCSLSCCAERCRSPNLNVVAWAEGANQANQDLPPLPGALTRSTHTQGCVFSYFVSFTCPKQHNSFYILPKNVVSFKL